MTKPLVSSLVLLATLCTPALAAPAAPTAPVRLKFTVRIGATTRTHELVLDDHECGEAIERTPDYSDEIHACVSINAAREIGLRVEWSTREANNEYKLKTSALVTAGKPFVLDGDAAHLAIAAG